MCCGVGIFFGGNRVDVVFGCEDFCVIGWGVDGDVDCVVFV